MLSRPGVLLPPDIPGRSTTLVGWLQGCLLQRKGSQGGFDASVSGYWLGKTKLVEIMC